jgi:hypothetical protein
MLKRPNATTLWWAWVAAAIIIIAVGVIALSN